MGHKVEITKRKDRAYRMAAVKRKKKLRKKKAARSRKGG